MASRWPGLCSIISSHVTLLSPAKQPSNTFLGVWSGGSQDERANFGVRLQCKAVPKPNRDDVLHDGLPVMKRNVMMVDDMEGKALEVNESNKVPEFVDSIRSMLVSMNDGEISIAAYDTAWVALIEDVHGNGGPQFPSCLQWIANNQLSDGSWGDSSVYEAHDRILSTLACVIALKSWNIHPDKSEKGMWFINENICKLEDGIAEHMPAGFEVIVPSLIEIARKLDLEVPDDSPVLQEIYAKRDRKLTRIPKDMMHIVPTILLYCLEGIPDLEWEKLLKLQCQDGSFLFSPSSTAFAFMQTKDENCLRYLSRVVERFNGGVPSAYPIDLFEHIWVIDRLERLGISRYFSSEINECMDYVYRYWTEEGIGWARNALLQDLDDTAMGFRLLRLHGYQVSADVFRQFKKGDKFFCFLGQSIEGVTVIFNLYRASQVLFSGEKILENAKNFSSKFLKEKQASNELQDKWIITKDLPGEVRYALDVPWYASLPRVETRFYLEQYGGEDVVWIGKTLYRLHYVNNNIYQELAKLDYNNCQALHQVEWDNIQKWYKECNLGEFGMSQRSLLLVYFLAASSIFEPERSKERLAWAKSATLMETIVSYFEKKATSSELRRSFLREFRNNGSHQEYVNNGRYKKTTGRGQGQQLVGTLLETLNQISLETLAAHGRDIRHHLCHAWEMWIMTWQEDGEAELLVRTISLCAGRWPTEDSQELLSLLSHPQYKRLSDITNNICHQLRQFQKHRLDKIQDKDKEQCNTTVQIESDMQELTQLVLCASSDDIDHDIKQTFLTVAKTYYYSVHCTPGTIYFHIAKVLFERVI